jgi:uncharacterized protein with von Willebrand factor type A (vWA) domain
MGLRAAARRLFNREARLSENVVAHSKLDSAVLRDWRKRAPMLAEEFEQPPEVNGKPLNPRVWERMVEDTFYAYFGKDEPEIAARDAVEPEFRVNRAVADKQTRSEQFAKQRPKTRMRGMEASLGACAALDSIRRSYERDMEEDAERASDIADSQDTLEDLDRQMAELREQRAEAEPGDVEAIDEQVRALAGDKRDETKKLAALEQEQAGRVVDIAQGAQRAAVAANAAAERAVEQASKMIGFGPGKSPGTEARVSPDVMFNLAERYARSSVLQAVAEMLGRLELTMGAERRTMRKGGSEEMVDIELGNDLAFVLPQEKMLLRHPMGRLDFYRRFSEQSLMQYEMWSELEEKRGSMIVVVDGSASMKGAKNVWARATCLALVGIANREGRDAAVIEFGSPGQARTFRWPKGQPLDPVECADFAEHAFNGGTSTFTGLRVASEILHHERPFRSADVVIASDGEDRLTDEDIALRDEFREMGVRIHGMSIGIAPTKYLLDMCERTTPVYEYSGHNEANHRLAVDLT